MERTMHRLTIHITDNDKFDNLVELDGLQPYADREQRYFTLPE